MPGNSRMYNSIIKVQFSKCLLLSADWRLQTLLPRLSLVLADVSRLFVQSRLQVRSRQTWQGWKLLEVGFTDCDHKYKKTQCTLHWVERGWTVPRPKLSPKPGWDSLRGFEGKFQRKVFSFGQRIVQFLQHTCTTPFHYIAMQREFYRRKLYHRFAEIISERHFGPKVPKWTKIHLFCVDNVAQCTYGIWRAPGTQFWPNEYGGGPKIEKQLGSFSSIFDVKRPLQIYLLKNTFTFKGLHNFSFPKHVCAR